MIFRENFHLAYINRLEKLIQIKYFKLGAENKKKSKSGKSREAEEEVSQKR